MQPYFDELSQPVVKLDRDVTSVLENSVLLDAVGYRLAREQFSTDAEVDLDLREHLETQWKKKYNFSLLECNHSLGGSNQFLLMIASKPAYQASRSYERQWE